MKVCISCQKPIEGTRAVRVKEDRIIRTIRTIKKFLGIAQMNELYVSEEHLEEHLKRRRSFEKSMLFASVFSGLIIIVVVVALLLSGRFDLWAIFSALIIGVFILALPLFKYAPAVESTTPSLIPGVAPKPKPVPAKKAPKKKTAKKTKTSRKKKKR